jgi:hypothetical protein
MHILISFLLIFIFFLLVGTTVSWIILSHSVYTKEILQPGKPYTLGGREYIMGNIPIQGQAFKIKDEVADSLRSLLYKTGKFLDSKNITWWVTGGTLLGIERNSVVPLPWDDDVDLAVMFDHRDLVFSREFSQEALKYGIDLFTLFTNTRTSADRHGGVVRAQHYGDSDSDRYESLDIFFWKPSTTNSSKICKLDGWRRNKTCIENRTETFELEDVFPIRRITCDQLEVCVPKHPRALLEKQYGPKVWDSARPRPLLVSHAFPIRFLNLLFVRGS